jgi:hypothetical protein
MGWAPTLGVQVLEPEPERSLWPLVQRINLALLSGHHPILPGNSCGGSYIIENLAIFKPADEEAWAPQNPKGRIGELGAYKMRKSLPVGQSAERECAAYMLDQGIESGVPPTFLARLAHSIFYDVEEGERRSLRLIKEKAGSLQLFADCDGSARAVMERCPDDIRVDSVHRLGVLDIRCANTDRHPDNILAKQHEDQSWSLIPIDHGLAFPENFDELKFGWLKLPQCREPFSQEELERIARFDVDRDAELLRGFALPEKSITVMRRATWWLQKAAAADWNLQEIGQFMCRRRFGKRRSSVPSGIERLVKEAEDAVEERLRSEGLAVLGEDWKERYVERIDLELLALMEDLLQPIDEWELDLLSSFSPRSSAALGFAPPSMPAGHIRSHHSA